MKNLLTLFITCFCLFNISAQVEELVLPSCNEFECEDLNSCDVQALGNVSNTVASEDQILVWNDVTGLWTPQSAPTYTVTEVYSGGANGDSLITTTHTYTGLDGLPQITEFINCNPEIYVDGNYIVHIRSNCEKDSINLVCPAP